MNKNKIDFNAQARTNPIFLTAKTAICFMANAKIPESVEIVRCLGLENNEPLNEIADSDTILGNSLVVETKYRTMCNLIKNSGYHTCVDLPCGYTPKALHMTEKGLKFIGLDLPIVVQEISPIIYSLAKYPQSISFFGVDATNYESLETALSDIDEQICITTEGMMMYFTENEVDTVISNISSLLNLYGGCWITPDPEFKLQFTYSFLSVFGKNSLDKLNNSGKVAQKQSNVVNLSNSFIVDATDIQSSTKNAENLLLKHGLKAEKINLAENMPELSIYHKLTAEQILKFKDAMKNCNYWRITPEKTKNLQENVAISKKCPFDMSYNFENGNFLLKLSGRFDSLSAPKILMTLETEKKSKIIDGIQIDCSELEYISSAGTRMLSNIQKNFNRGVVLFNVNSYVSTILAQNGFTQVGERNWKLSDNF